MYSPENQSRPHHRVRKNFVQEIEDLRDYTPLRNPEKDLAKDHKDVGEEGQKNIKIKLILRRPTPFKSCCSNCYNSFTGFGLSNVLRFLGIPIITRYIVAEFLFSFFISFTFFFFIFLVNALLLVARKYAGEGLPLWAILKLIYYNIPTNVSLSLPFSVLVGALMAVGHLGASNQILAFRTCSVRRASILTPLLICSLFSAVGSFILATIFLPLGRINTQKIILQLLSNNPKVIINPYSVRSFRSEKR